jgi:polar amino acid transport system permease protein
MVFNQIPLLLQYLPVTLELTALALVIGWTVGVLIAIIEIKKIPVLWRLSALFVSFVRGTPIIVQLYITYFGIPLALRYFNYYSGSNYNINSVPPIVFAIIALGLNQSAFDSESIRAAFLSVDKSQLEAANSLGMTGVQILRRVLFPQAITVALPSLGNSLISLIKGTSLAFTCSVVEMTAQGKIISGRTFRYFEIYCSLAIIYWVLTIIVEKVFKYLEIATRVPEKVIE